ncbi:hypothetical protein Lal_00016966 [Lupinus albus]|nr:hypothetical protein Lal_00016966 [Lupinus albus]
MTKIGLSRLASGAPRLASGAPRLASVASGAPCLASGAPRLASGASDSHLISYPPPTAFSASPFHTHFLPSYNHHQFPLHLQQPHQQQHHRFLSFPIPPLQPQPISFPSNPNAGAHLMALLSAPPQPSSPVVTNLPPIAIITTANAATAALNQVQSSKVPKGRHLTGDHIVYDVDTRLPGEVQPQLEVKPITKYGSDRNPVLGRQIAVNKSYICYGLKQGNIRVLNIRTAVRSLLRGHTMIVGEEKVENPQICWHCYKQMLIVGMGKHLLRIDTRKVGNGEAFVAEDPPICHFDKLIDGVQLVGTHDGEVTDLSMCQWIRNHLVSASQDGTRVTDLAFFAEDVHLLASVGADCRIYVWKISEGVDIEEKPQITADIVIAIQIVGEEKVENPQICWHCYKQMLIVGMGKHLLRIDTRKVGNGEAFVAEDPPICHFDKLIDGVQLVGTHDGEVTDLSMCQWIRNHLVSASQDGTYAFTHRTKSCFGCAVSALLNVHQTHPKTLCLLSMVLSIVSPSTHRPLLH